MMSDKDPAAPVVCPEKFGTVACDSRAPSVSRGPRGPRCVPLSAAAWEAYYRPMETRIETLAPFADEALAQVLEEGRQEAAGWRRVKRETGYLQAEPAPRAMRWHGPSR